MSCHPLALRHAGCQTRRPAVAYGSLLPLLPLVFSVRESKNGKGFRDNREIAVLGKDETPKNKIISLLVRNQRRTGHQWETSV